MTPSMMLLSSEVRWDKSGKSAITVVLGVGRGGRAARGIVLTDALARRALRLRGGCESSGSAEAQAVHLVDARGLRHIGLQRPAPCCLVEFVPLSHPSDESWSQWAGSWHRRCYSILITAACFCFSVAPSRHRGLLRNCIVAQDPRHTTCPNCEDENNNEALRTAVRADHLLWGCAINGPRCAWCASPQPGPPSYSSAATHSSHARNQRHTMPGPNR